MVIATLANPRDKFWGTILSLTAEGVSLCGIELASFDDFIAMIKEGGPISPGVVFFPMQRVERIELDSPDGDVPSISQRFAARAGLDAVTVLTDYAQSQDTAGKGRK
jgi:hypothetical protein